MVTKKKPLGRFGPWCWSVEFVRGCNLACWHCSVPTLPYANDPEAKVKFMSMETWEQMCHVLAQVTPYTRLETAQGGEPTLHPEILDAIRMVKKISPTTQVQVTTNGVTLLKGRISHVELFEAGANSVYVDCYGPDGKFDPEGMTQEEAREKHLELAKEARRDMPGIEWYYYYKPKDLASSKEHWMANTFYNDPEMKQIILQDTPEHRTKWRRGGRLSTFLNHVDWNESMQYGLVPVREPLKRKCNMPSRYVSTDWRGNYLFCCIDFACETAGLMGNVSDGPEKFRDYWQGRLMQSIRRRIGEGDRAGVPYCSRCDCAFSRCDMKIWPDGSHDQYFSDGEWTDMPPLENDDEVFAHGWAEAERVQSELPTIEEEEAALAQSSLVIIKSRGKGKKPNTQNRQLPFEDREE